MKRSDETSHSRHSDGERHENDSANEVLTKIPVTQLEVEIERFLEPATKRLPEKRLRKVVNLAT